MLRQGRAVQLRGNQGVGVHSFLNRDTADEWRHFAGNFVETAEHHMFAGAFHAGAFEDVAQPGTTETPITDRALLPLDSGDFRGLKRASIAGAL